MRLEPLFSALHHYPFVDYRRASAITPLLVHTLRCDGSERSPAAEELSISGRGEIVSLVTFPPERITVVGYGGRSPKAMQKTMAALHLPSSYGSSIGERTFYLFQRRLVEAAGAPLYMEQHLRTEGNFRTVLERLCAVYAAAANGTSAGV